MRRRINWLLVSVLLVVVSIGSDSPKGYDDKTEETGIEGMWQAVACEYDGKQTGFCVTAFVTFQCDKYVGSIGDRRWSEGTYAANAGRKPASVDMIASGLGNGSAVKIIYRVDGDTLQIGDNWLGGDRLKNFDAEEITITTYKRVKK